LITRPFIFINIIRADESARSLIGKIGSRDQDSKLSLSKSRNQARDSLYAYTAVTCVAFCLHRKFNSHTILRQTKTVLAVREHGGVVQDFTGDGIMAVFGAPIALEDGH
jgi:hypothetical protein